MIHLNTYVMVIRNILIFSVRDRLYTSESDIYRRQILMSEVGPRSERVNRKTMSLCDFIESEYLFRFCYIYIYIYLSI